MDCVSCLIPAAKPGDSPDYNGIVYLTAPRRGVAVHSGKAISQVSGLLLAGGQARRMGGADKGLLTLGGRPLVAWGLERLASQVGEVMISANRNHTHYEQLGVSVISDGVSGYAGPLAGMAAGLGKASQDWVLNAPCDSPLLAKDYAARMYAAGASGEFDAVVAHDGKRLQPVFMMLNRQSQPSLEAFLAGGGRKIDLWLEDISHARVDFSDHEEMFLNVNTPEDLEEMESRIADDPDSPE